MRAQVRLFDDDGKEVQTIEVPFDLSGGGRWWLHEYEKTSERELDMYQDGARRLIGLEVKPFVEIVDDRDGEEIERENSRGGNGRVRAEALGIPHAETTSETERFAAELAERTAAERTAAERAEGPGPGPAAGQGVGLDATRLAGSDATRLANAAAKRRRRGGGAKHGGR